MNFYKFESVLGKTLVNMDNVSYMIPSSDDEHSTRIYFVGANEFRTNFVEVKEEFENIIGRFAKIESARRLYE